MLLSKCAAWSREKSGFLKEKEAKRLVSSLAIKTPLRNIPLLSKTLF